MKKIILCILLTFTTSSFAGPEATSTAEPITLFCNEYKPPKSWMVDGVAKGISIDIINWINKQSVQQYQLKLYPWKRAYNLAAAGQGGIIGFSKTEYRTTLFDFSEPIFFDDMMLVALKGKEFPFEKLEDLRGKKISIVRGASFGLDYEKGIKQGIFTAIETNSPSQGFHMMREGRVDVVLIGPGQRGVEKVFELDPKLALFRDQYSTLKKPFVSDPNHIAFAKSMNMEKQLEELNQLIKLGWESGKFDEIINFHMNNSK